MTGEATFVAPAAGAMSVVGVVGQLTVGATVKLKTELDVLAVELQDGKASTDQ